MSILLIVLNLCLIKLFSVNRFSESFIYQIRFIVYFFSFIVVAYSLLRNKIFFSLRIDNEGFIFGSPIFKKNSKLRFKSIEKVQINELFIKLLFTYNEKELYHVIPRKTFGIIQEEDFRYLEEIFFSKNIDVEYINLKLNFHHNLNGKILLNIINGLLIFMIILVILLSI